MYRAGFCSKCYYWHRKALRTQRGETTGCSSRRNQISIAERVLQEYAWRERNLNAPDVDSLAIEELVHAVAAECRSEIGFSIHSLLNNQTPEARRCIYSLFPSYSREHALFYAPTSDVETSRKGPVLEGVGRME